MLPQMSTEIEDYLKRIDEVTKVVQDLVATKENDTTKPAVSQFAPTTEESALSNGSADPSKSRKDAYSADYSRWERFKEEEAEGTKPKAELDLERKVFLNEANRARETGNKHFNEGEYQQAFECYTRSCVLDEANAVHFLNRAQAGLKLSRWDQAIEDCNTVLKLDRQNLKAFHRRATAYQQSERFAEAVKDWDVVVAMNPKAEEARTNLSKCRNEVALRKSLDQAIAKDKKNFDTLREMIERFNKVSTVFMDELNTASPGMDTSMSEQATSSTSTKVVAASRKPIPNKNLLELLFCLGNLPLMLGQKQLAIFFRVQGGLKTAAGLLKRFTGPYAQNIVFGGNASAAILVEGCFSLLAFALGEESNLSWFVDLEKASVVKESKNSEPPTATTESLLLPFSTDVAMKADKSTSQAALHFLSTATSHPWICEQLRQHLTVQSLVSFPVHDRSGTTLAHISHLFDNFLRSEPWSKDLKSVNLRDFLLPFVSSQFPLLQRNAVGTIMRMTTIPHFRDQIMESDSNGKFTHMEILIKALAGLVKPSGSETYSVPIDAAYTMEGLLSSMFNCITGTTDLTKRETICSRLHEHDVFKYCAGIIVSYKAKEIERDLLPVVCRALGVLSKAAAPPSIFSSVVNSNVIETTLKLAAQFFDAVCTDELEKDTVDDPNGVAYKENVVEYCTVIWGLCTNRGVPANVHEILFTQWAPAIAALVAHPNNNISGNAALIIAALADDAQRASAMVSEDNTKTFDLTKKLLDAIIAKRDELHNFFRHFKNTAANSKMGQKNCAIALAKLASKNTTCRDRLRELQGIEILHTVLQQDGKP